MLFNIKQTLFSNHMKIICSKGIFQENLTIFDKNFLFQNQVISISLPVATALVTSS